MNELTQSFDDAFRDITVASDLGSVENSDSGIGQFSTGPTITTVADRYGIEPLADRHRNIARLDPSRLLGDFAVRIIDRYGTADLTFRDERPPEEPSTEQPRDLDEKQQSAESEKQGLNYLAGVDPEAGPGDGWDFLGEAAGEPSTDSRRVDTPGGVESGATPQFLPSDATETEQRKSDSAAPAKRDNPSRQSVPTPTETAEGSGSVAVPWRPRTGSTDRRMVTQTLATGEVTTETIPDRTTRRSESGPSLQVRESTEQHGSTTEADTDSTATSNSSATHSWIDTTGQHQHAETTQHTDTRAGVAGSETATPARDDPAGRSASQASQNNGDRQTGDRPSTGETHPSTTQSKTTTTTQSTGLTGAVDGSEQRQHQTESTTENGRSKASDSTGHSPLTSTRETHRDRRTVSTVLADRSPTSESPGTVGSVTSRSSQPAPGEPASSVGASEDDTQRTQSETPEITRRGPPNATDSTKTAAVDSTHAGVEPDEVPTSAVEPSIGVQSPGVLELEPGSEKERSGSVQRPTSGQPGAGRRPELTHRQRQEPTHEDTAEPTRERTETSVTRARERNQSTSIIDRRSGWDPTGRVATGRPQATASQTGRKAVTERPERVRDDWSGSSPQPTVSTQTANKLSTTAPRADRDSRTDSAGVRIESPSSETGTGSEPASRSTESGETIDRTGAVGLSETGPSPTPDERAGAASPDDPASQAATPTSRREPVEPGQTPTSRRDAVETGGTPTTTSEPAVEKTTPAARGRSVPEPTSWDGTPRSENSLATRPSKIGATASELAVTRWSRGTETPDTGYQNQQAMTPARAGGAESARMVPQTPSQQTQDSGGRQTEATVDSQTAASRRHTEQAASHQSSGNEPPRSGWSQRPRAEREKTGDNAGVRKPRLPGRTVSTPTLATVQSEHQSKTASGGSSLDRPAPEPDRRTASESSEVSKADRSPSSESAATVGATGRGSTIDGQPVDGGQDAVQSSGAERLPTTPVQRLRSETPSVSPTTGSWARDTLLSTEQGTNGRQQTAARPVPSRQVRQVLDRSGNSVPDSQETPTTASQGSLEPRRRSLLGDQRPATPGSQGQSRLADHSPATESGQGQSRLADHSPATGSGQGQSRLADHSPATGSGQGQSRLADHSTLTYQSEGVLDGRPAPERQEQSALDAQRTGIQNTGQQSTLDTQGRQPTESTPSVLDDQRAGSSRQDGPVLDGQQRVQGNQGSSILDDTGPVRAAESSSVIESNSPVTTAEGSSVLGSGRRQTETSGGQSRIETLTLQRTPKSSARSGQIGGQSPSRPTGQQSVSRQTDSQPGEVRNLPPTASTPGSVARRQQALTSSVGVSRSMDHTDGVSTSAGRAAKTTTRTPAVQTAQSQPREAGDRQDSDERGHKLLADNTAPDRQPRESAVTATDDGSPGSPAQTARRPVPDRQQAGSSRTVQPPTTVTPSVLAEAGGQPPLGQHGTQQSAIGRSDGVDSGGQAETTPDEPATPGTNQAPTTVAASSRTGGRGDNPDESGQQPTTALDKGAGPATRGRPADVTNGLTNTVQSRANMTNQMDKYLTRKREAATEQAMSGAVTDGATARRESDSDEPSFVYRSPISAAQTDQQGGSVEERTTQSHIDRSTGQSPTDRVETSGANSPQTDIQSAGERFVNKADRQTGERRDTGNHSSGNTRQDRQQQTKTEAVRPAEQLETQRHDPSLPDQPSTPQQTPAHTSDRSGRETQRSRRHRSTDIGVPDESLEYEADVDRVVERLHRKLERRKRIERERKGER